MVDVMATFPPNTTLLRLDTEFDAYVTHSGCADCVKAADGAIVHARVTGSTGAVWINGEHRADATRVRCTHENSAAVGGDCLCPVCRRRRMSDEADARTGELSTELTRKESRVILFTLRGYIRKLEREQAKRPKFVPAPGQRDSAAYNLEAARTAYGKMREQHRRLFPDDDPEAPR